LRELASKEIYRIKSDAREKWRLKKLNEEQRRREVG
jgi:hypothetical protein